MLWTDLRQFLQLLDERKELRLVKGANWEEEIGAITELVTERRGPALMFDDVPGYPSGYRVISNVFTNPERTALALGLGTEPGYFQRWRERMHTRGTSSP